MKFKEILQKITKPKIILIFLVIIVLILGVSYSLWTTTDKQKDKNVAGTSCLDIDYQDISEGINLIGEVPMTDDQGLDNPGYAFKITNTCNSIVEYDINLESLSDVEKNNRLDIDSIKINLNDSNNSDTGIIKISNQKLQKTQLPDNESYDTRLIKTDILVPNKSKEYTLKIWLDESTSKSEMNKFYKSKISIYGYTSSKLVYNMKITDFIKILAEDKIISELIYDDTKDKNIRYIGKAPNNYIDVENGEYPTDIWIGHDSTDICRDTVEYHSYEECSKNTKYNKQCTQLHKKGDPILWRIIGVMNDGYTTSSDNKPRLKIIRDEDIGRIAWDAKTTNDQEVECNNCTYKNNWEEASLNKTLNEAFWNKSTTTTKNYIYEYNKENNTFSNNWEYLDFSKEGLNAESKKYIGEVLWHLGGFNSYDEYSPATALDYYTKERSSSIYTGNKSTWTGYIGLMYPSDYGYATSGGTKITKDTCLKKELYNWSDLEDCYENNWLFDPLSEGQLMLNPYAGSVYDAARMSCNEVFPNGNIFQSYFSVRPVLYLKSNVKIISGTGTKENPFKISL